MIWKYIYIYGTEVENGPCIYKKIRFVITFVSYCENIV